MDETHCKRFYIRDIDFSLRLNLRRLSYRGGVTKAITAPKGTGFLLGLSTTFAVGAAHALEDGAILQDETALHVAINRGMVASVSTQIATLRRLLFESEAPSWTDVREVCQILQLTQMHCKLTTKSHRA